MVTFKFESQLQSILKRSSNLEQVVNFNKNAKMSAEYPNINASTGSIYREATAKSGEDKFLLSFNLNSDGAPLLRSSKFDIWPILMSIVELPQPVSESFRNMITLGKRF
jgi:hypothetical protein